MNTISRKQFLKYTAASSAALLLSSLEGWAADEGKKLRGGVIGCGSVSNKYLPQLLSSKSIEVVSLCDIKPERAAGQNKQYNVNAKTYKNIDEMLARVPFDMMVTIPATKKQGASNT